ncbi:MAG: quinoprotein relay system zinc metallohydrolase 2 [Pseudomonadota bacterium]|nr:quinoprotein relay system zinc metallohydrolase 2 [Pseudomonadota bacterium]
MLNEKNFFSSLSISNLKRIPLVLFLILFPSTSFSFSIEEVANGVYVHKGLHDDSNKKNEGDIANIGFIVGEKSIMVIDTGSTTKIGNLLLQKIKKTSNLPISHIVITHSHPDHFFGTEAFYTPSVKIVGHEKLNRSLISNFEFYRDLQFNTIGIDSIKKTKLIQANQIIKTGKTLKIDLGDRLVEVRAWRSGHTDNDLSVFDIKTKTFWSENIFVERIPSIRANIKGWRENLEEILRMDINLIVPGHGKVSQKNEAIKPMIDYFNRLIKEIRDLHKENKSLKESLDQVSKENPENWILFDDYHYTNITKVYTELEWE